MSSEYSWRDGWALDFPIQKPQPPRADNTERVARCKSCGNWLYKQEPCAVCALLEGNK